MNTNFNRVSHKILLYLINMSPVSKLKPMRTFQIHIHMFFVPFQTCVRYQKKSYPFLPKLKLLSGRHRTDLCFLDSFIWNILYI